MKRYRETLFFGLDLLSDKTRTVTSTMLEDPDGKWVKYEDVGSILEQHKRDLTSTQEALARMVKERDEALNDIKELKSQIENIKAAKQAGTKVGKEKFHTGGCSVNLQRKNDDEYRHYVYYVLPIKPEWFQNKYKEHRAYTLEDNHNEVIRDLIDEVLRLGIKANWDARKMNP